jgi:putative ubiquitin-RnfH superfamily antitoxin RatB of RatAB toxin-antitoxin module
MRFPDVQQRCSGVARAAVNICVEIVYATEERQELLTLEVPVGATVAAAIGLSELASLFPNETLDSCTVGVWGRTVERSRVVQEGDRIELYRSLQKDPRQARRERALIRPVSATKP